MYYKYICYKKYIGARMYYKYICYKKYIFSFQTYLKIHKTHA